MWILKIHFGFISVSFRLRSMQALNAHRIFLF